MENKETSVVVAEEQEKDLVMASNPVDFFSGVGNIWTSLPQDGSRESKLALLNAMDNTEANLRDICGTVLDIENIVCHSIRLQTDSGEEIDAVRTVLIATDGKCYATVGDGVRASLAKMFAVLGMPPWKPSIKVSPKEVTTRRGYRVLKLETVLK